MDFLDEMGSLALGSRLRRLSERLGQEVSAVYKLQNLDFQPKWFPVFRFVAQQGSASVTDIATAIGITHPAVNLISDELLKAGLVTSVADRGDKRRRILSLSASGKRVKQQLDPVWKVLHASLSDVSEGIQNDLVNVILRFEQALDDKSLAQRYTELKTSVLQGKVSVMSLEPSLAHHFARLNRIWIEKYFCLESEDMRVLSDPQRIVDAGGFVFFALLGGKVVGTCALIKGAHHDFELAKMAVDEAYRGCGIGANLMIKCIETATKAGAKRIVLETNSCLKSAVQMYKKFGFAEVSGEQSSKFARVNMIMQLELAKAELRV
ncbi:MAG TPA: bifunctional helix-turn-helix transcriptional regulator/GNAT family N-acetyltransferase [Oculatellaceae cyanobacterium]